MPNFLPTCLLPASPVPKRRAAVGCLAPGCVWLVGHHGACPCVLSVAVVLARPLSARAWLAPGRAVWSIPLPPAAEMQEEPCSCGHPRGWGAFLQVWLLFARAG